ncbi:hypothetical protein NEIFLAOT_00728 [Neisseria flavescens NRL30031/H210]|uniref:Uncharacterized protein n=1 Tax=Neisseria flavescens NRL30031/H210 TaxID=546264 RepID=C0ELC3_NEIFL|nr:hypothetical protein NEIFLAOT_00728 [Neisseria flavescens NRL30031/H210]
MPDILCEVSRLFQYAPNIGLRQTAGRYPYAARRRSLPYNHIV